jgi:hypothetical protein
MPTVDFTLEDITRVIVAERAYTRAMVEQIVNSQFMSFWDNNLSPVLDELSNDVKDFKRIAAAHGQLLDQHSRDIMELRATRPTH